MKAYLLFSFFIMTLIVASNQGFVFPLILPKGRVCLRSYNFKHHFISLDGSLAKIRTCGPKKFKLVQALAGNHVQPAVSFLSLKYRNRYLRHRGYLIYADFKSTQKLFKDDASFFVHLSQWFPGYYSFESVNYPGFYIRHQNFRLKISKYPHRRRPLFQRDASYRIERC